MVGPHRATAPEAIGLAASCKELSEKFGVQAGVGPNFWMAGGGDRLCRSAEGFTPGDFRRGAT